MIRAIISNNDGEFIFKNVNFIRIDGEDFIVNYQDENDETHEEIGPIPGDVIVEDNQQGIKRESNMLTHIGDTSNLIVDMTMNGATLEEIERVTSYSLKVIDLKISYRDLGIEELMQEYGKEGQYDTESKN